MIGVERSDKTGSGVRLNNPLQIFPGPGCLMNTQKQARYINYFTRDHFLRTSYFENDAPLFVSRHGWHDQNTLQNGERTIQFYHRSVSPAVPRAATTPRNEPSYHQFDRHTTYYIAQLLHVFRVRKHINQSATAQCTGKFLMSLNKQPHPEKGKERLSER
jgi:hypothetical protein